MVAQLGLSEADVTKYHLEFIRLKHLHELPDVFKGLGSTRAINYFLKLTNLALAEGLTTDKVITLLNLVGYSTISSVQKRMEEVKRMLICLESELDEQKDLLHQYSEKTTSAKSNYEVWKNACRELMDEFMIIHNEKQSLENWVYGFKHNNSIYLEIQNVVKGKVNAFLAEYNGRKLLEFALAAVAEVLRQDPLLIEEMPNLKSYCFDPEKLFFPNPYDYSDNRKERAFELSNEIYNKMVKGLADVAISTAAGLGASAIS